MQECPRDTDPLFFSAGQRIAEFSDFGVVAIWQCHDEIMYGRLLRRLHNFFPLRAGFCNSDIVRNRIVEQDHGTSIASLAVAAHECGHALQHQEGYRPLTFRNAIVPVCNFSYNLGWVAIMIGLFMGRTSIAWIGVLLTSLMLLFQIVTLPVEFDASSRALSILNDRYLVQDEYFGAKKMLTAAALTYVAGMLSTLLSLLRIVLVVLGNDRGRD